MRPSGKKGTNNPAWAERNAVERSTKMTRDGAPATRTKVTRYRAGVTPEWAKRDDESSSSSSSSSSGNEKELDEGKLETKSASRRTRTTTTTPTRDLKRESSSESESESEEEDEEESSEDEDARDRKRALLKAKLLTKSPAALVAAAAPAEEEDREEKKKKKKQGESSSSSSSEYETDTEDESGDESSSSSSSESEGTGPKLFKPVFVSKTKREANAKAELSARREAEKDEEDLEEEKLIKNQNAKEAVQREITLEYQREVAEKDYLGEEVNTDSDEEDEEEARRNYEQWKMREFKRIVRDRCKQRLEVEEEGRARAVKKHDRGGKRVTRGETESAERRQRARKREIEDALHAKVLPQRGVFPRSWRRRVRDDGKSGNFQSRFQRGDERGERRGSIGRSGSDEVETRPVWQGRKKQVDALVERRYHVREHRGRALTQRARGADEAKETRRASEWRSRRRRRRWRRREKRLLSRRLALDRG